jgi:hypothetical protein
MGPLDEAGDFTQQIDYSISRLCDGQSEKSHERRGKKLPQVLPHMRAGKA